MSLSKEDKQATAGKEISVNQKKGKKVKKMMGIKAFTFKKREISRM